MLFGSRKSIPNPWLCLIKTSRNEDGRANRKSLSLDNIFLNLLESLFLSLDLTYVETDNLIGERGDD